VAPLSWAQKRKLLKFFEPSIRQHPDWPVVISEGDSWFSFPIHHNTVDFLDDMVQHRISLLRLEKSGDELLSIFTGRQKAKLRRYLGRYPVQALLFSGGGNDIVGADFLALLKTKTPGMTWRDCVHDDRAERKIAQLECAYRELVDIRDDNRPGCVIYVHGYDYAIPTGVGAKLWGIKVGPWMKTYLDEKNITEPADQRSVVAWLIDRFNDMLANLSLEHPNFVHVETRSTLAQNEWNDELHPTRDGFREIAALFKAQLASQFPGFF